MKKSTIALSASNKEKFDILKVCQKKTADELVGILLSHFEHSHNQDSLILPVELNRMLDILSMIERLSTTDLVAAMLQNYLKNKLAQ